MDERRADNRVSKSKSKFQLKIDTKSPLSCRMREGSHSLRYGFGSLSFGSIVSCISSSFQCFLCMVLVEFEVSFSLLRSPYSHFINLDDFSVFIGKTNLYLIKCNRKHKCGHCAEHAVCDPPRPSLQDRESASR